MPSAICSPYWCLAGSEVWAHEFWRIPGLSNRRRRRPLQPWQHPCQTIPNLPKILQIFSPKPYRSIWERGAPRQNPAPPSRFAVNKKHAFFWQASQPVSDPSLISLWTIPILYWLHRAGHHRTDIDTQSAIIVSWMSESHAHVYGYAARELEVWLSRSDTKAFSGRSVRRKGHSLQ
jgi:hypothetical protein